MASLAWLFDGTYSRKQARQLIGALVGGKGSARPLGGYSGLTSPVAVSATSTTWTVGAFTGIMDVESDATMGPFLIQHDGGTGSVTAASSSFIRYDLLYVTVVDATTTLPTIGYVAGTVATTLPATPANSIPLAQLTVPISGGGAPTVTIIAPQAVAAGGIIPASGASAYPTNPRVGQEVNDFTLGKLVRTPSATWGRDVNDTGWINITSMAGGFSTAFAQARLCGNRVDLQGGLSNTSYATASFTTAANLPAGIPAPLTNKIFGINSTGSATKALQITTGGAIQAYSTAGTSTVYSLDGVYWYTD